MHETEQAFPYLQYPRAETSKPWSVGQIAGFVDKVLLVHSHIPCCVVYGHSQAGSWLAAVEIVWSVEPKIFTSWLLTEKVCQPMGVISGLLHIQSSKIAYQFFSTSFESNHQIFIEAYYIRRFTFGFKGWKNSAEVDLS